MTTDKQTIQWYNDNAEDYTAHVRNPNDSLYHSYYEKPAMRTLLPDLKGKKIISLGCGSGEDSHYLKELGAVGSIGVDIAEKLVNIARESYPDCEFKVMDMEKLDFPDESFDFAYSSLALHYIKDWTKVFSETYRILKADSYFLFSCGHPVRSAMFMTENTEEKQVRQTAVVKNKKTKDLTIIGNYLDRRELHDGLGTMGTVTTWHKSISEIFHEAQSVGFSIDKFIEPRPLLEMRQYSERDYNKLIKIPEFMIIRLKK